MEQNTVSGKLTLLYLPLFDNQVLKSGTKSVKSFYQITLRLELPMKMCAFPKVKNVWKMGDAAVQMAKQNPVRHTGDGTLNVHHLD